MPSASASHRLVKPLTPVSRNVTTHEGAAGIEKLYLLVQLIHRLTHHRYASIAAAAPCRLGGSGSSVRFIRAAGPAWRDRRTYIVGRPPLELGQMLSADFDIRSGQRATGVLTADRPATGAVHARFGRAVTARDVEHIAIGVGGEPTLIADVVVTELAHVHRLIFDHCVAPLGRDLHRSSRESRWLQAQETPRPESHQTRSLPRLTVLGPSTGGSIALPTGSSRSSMAS